ncbi:MAG: DNA-binding protein [Planctomycetota bacterium]|nr:MAG: DNA-binding protein [Planctomycetota bacterium]
MAKAAAKKPPTKTEIYASISEATGVAKKDVAAVFDALSDEVAKSLSKKGAQAFTIPGLCKIVVQHKPAQPAKKGVPNPFKPGELMDVAAKPAKNVVKVRALKKLKDMV